MKGWNPVEQFEDEKSARDAQFQAQSKPMLFVNVKNPGPVTARFGEQGNDVNTFYVHDYKVPDSSVQGGFASRRFTCSQQTPWNFECAGCRAGLKRKVRGVYNVIQRQRAVLRRGADGKAVKDGANNWIIDGHRDEVVIASVGGPTAAMLRKVDGNGGLMTRDWIISYSGDTFQAWTLQPSYDAAGNAMATPLSDADQQLLATKHNLDEFMKPPTTQEQAQIIAKFGGNSGAVATQPAQPAAPTNQFLQDTQLPPNVNALGAAVGVQPQQPSVPAQG